MNKKEWKKFYRMLRVTRRESAKAVTDMFIFGTGAVIFPHDGGDVKRVHPSEINLIVDKEGELISINKG